MSGISFLIAALLITAFSILLCIVYISYRVKEARESVRLIDADFPFKVRGISKKTIKGDEDLYDRPSSNARLATKMFYTADDIESLRRKASPTRLPKGRNKI